MVALAALIIMLPALRRQPVPQTHDRELIKTIKIFTDPLQLGSPAQ